MYHPSKECPVTYASEILGRKWSIIIIYYLLDGDKRFSELEDLIGNISPKVLSTTLDHLIEKGIVERVVINSKPVEIRYRLTDRGRELKNVIQELIYWSERWSDKS